MNRRKVRDPDNPPTRESDWIGAEVLEPGERHAQRTGPMTFHVFRASRNADVFLVTDHGDATRLPECSGGVWEPFKMLPETGKARVGFSEQAAKRDIASKGFHLARLRLVMPEHANRA